MSWKPEGYKCKYSKEDHHRGIYEEGYDAAIEALKATGPYTERRRRLKQPIERSEDGSIFLQVWGYQIFLEDEA